MGQRRLQAYLNPTATRFSVCDGLDDGHTAAIDFKRSDAGGYRMAREVDNQARRIIEASNGVT